MNEEGEVTFTYSGVIQKDKRNAVCVRFERKRGPETDYAEGLIPSCVLDKVVGFSGEEKDRLEDYLKEHKEEIIANAKKLNDFKSWFR